jgi:hypothetical protein
MTALWKFMKRLVLLFCGAYEVVLELAMSEVDKNLSIRRITNFVEGLIKEDEFLLCSRVLRGNPHLSNSD